MWVGLAVANLILARLAYVAGTGFMLRKQEREEYYTRSSGVEEGFRRFKRNSTWLMVWDTGAFILLNVMTVNTLHLPLPRWVEATLGLAIGLIGLGTKAWATRILGSHAYYWYNFFEPATPVQWVPRGPYKVLRNPMYGVGYLQTYGLALVCDSLHGMLGALFMQVAIYVFNETVEKPHFRALAKGQSAEGKPRA